MNLEERTAKGVVWSAAEKWGRQVVSFLVFFALARLLQPEVFGLIALASVFTGFAGMLIDQGFGAAVVQRADLRPRHLDTAFWTNLLIGCTLTLAGIALSGLIATMLKEPRLQPIIAWLSLSFLLAGLSSTQQSILQRNMDFRSLALRSLLATIVGGIIGVVLAALGYGVWSLVAQALVSAFVGVLVLWRASEWRPRFGFSREHFMELFAFGVNVSAKRMLVYVDTRLDSFLIGLFLGPIALGYYEIAYRLLVLPTSLFTDVIGTVAFPAFSRLQEESTRLRHGFYQVIQLVSLVAFPAFVGIVVLAPEIVTSLFGPKWILSGKVTQLLAPAGIAVSITLLHGFLITALGKPSWILRIRVPLTAFRAVIFTLAAQWDIFAVAAAFTVSAYASVPAYLWVTNRLIRLQWKAYFGRYVVPLTGSLVMAAAILGLGSPYSSLDAPLPTPWQLATHILVAGAVYVLVLAAMDRSLLQRLLRFGRMALSMDRSHAR